MDQFGVHMEFLQIKQVSVINLIPKIYFLICFSGFINYLDWTSFSVKHRGFHTKFPQTQQHPVLDCGLVF
jgi:TRAP-type mannitol/chloroaromatic compound transport system permease small subunit